MTIPENSVVFKRNISIGGGAPCDPLRLVQYDDTLPILAATLWLSGAKYTPPSGATVRIRWHKPDGTAAYNPAFGVTDDGVVYIQITQQMTAAAGVGFGNIEITTAAGVKNSDAIPFVIEKNAVQEGQIESSDEWLSVDEILKRVEVLQSQVEKDAATASTDAQRAETAREAAETAADKVTKIVAGNEAYTKQETHNLFARALVTDTGKGTSHEIYPDEGSNIVVTAYGYTEQEGEGDPSPENVRPIKVGGQPVYVWQFTGEEDYWTERVSETTGVRTFRTNTRSERTVLGGVCTDYSGSTLNTMPNDKTVYLAYTSTLLFRDDEYASVDEWKSHLSELYKAGMPLTVYGVPHPTAATSEPDGTFMLVATDGKPSLLRKQGCKGIAIPLAEPLCEGDYVVSNQDGQCVESHNTIYLEVDSNWVPTSVYTDTISGDYLGFHLTMASVGVNPDRFPTSTTGVSSHFKYGNTYNEIQESRLVVYGIDSNPPGGNFSFRVPMSEMVPYGFSYEDPNTIKTAFPAYAQAQKDAGTPIQLVLKISSPNPVVNTHAPVPLISRPDTTGKVTVSGERDVSAVYNKSLKKAFEELQSAILKLGGAQNV